MLLIFRGSLNMKTENKSIEGLLGDIESLKDEISRLRSIELEHENAERRLRESEERYRLLTSNVPLGLYRRTCGSTGTMKMVNPAFVEMFGYENHDQLMEVPIRDLYWNPAECEEFSEKMFAHGEVIKKQLKMRKKDGSPMWIAVTTKMIWDENGKPQYFDGIMEDITDRKLAEEEAALRQQQLMQADKMITLGILVSGVAHEINNPNQFIASHIAPLEKAWKDAVPVLDKYKAENGDFMLGGVQYSVRREQLPAMFSGVRKGSERIKYIVDELRDYAREHPSDVTEVVHINNVVKSALALLANLIKKSTNHFTVSYGEHMPTVIADYQRIEQVLINLVQNACQALHDKDKAISVRTYFDRRRGAVVVEVEDAGAGIAPDDLKHIKDPFFTTKRDKGGIGLGLSISAAIVAKHQGVLQFESEIGKGTTVAMMIPAEGGESETRRHDDTEVGED